MSLVPPRTSVVDLAFLQGFWQGGGLVLQFTQPYDDMLFGVLQVAQDAPGRYWEVFTFAEGDAPGELALSLSRRGGAAIPFVLAAVTPEPEPPCWVFERADASSPRRISLAAGEAGDRLLLAVEGERDGEPFREEWLLWRLAAEA